LLQFTLLQAKTAKTVETHILSFKVINADNPKKPVTSAQYGKEVNKPHNLGIQGH